MSPRFLMLQVESLWNTNKRLETMDFIRYIYCKSYFNYLENFCYNPRSIWDTKCKKLSLHRAMLKASYEINSTGLYSREINTPLLSASEQVEGKMKAVGYTSWYGLASIKILSTWKLNELLPLNYSSALMEIMVIISMILIITTCKRYYCLTFQSHSEDKSEIFPAISNKNKFLKERACCLSLCLLQTSGWITNSRVFFFRKRYFMPLGSAVDTMPSVGKGLQVSCTLGLL